MAYLGEELEDDNVRKASSMTDIFDPTKDESKGLKVQGPPTTTSSSNHQKNEGELSLLIPYEGEEARSPSNSQHRSAGKSQTPGKDKKEKHSKKTSSSHTATMEADIMNIKSRLVDLEMTVLRQSAKQESRHQDLMGMLSSLAKDAHKIVENQQHMAQQSSVMGGSVNPQPSSIFGPGPGMGETPSPTVGPTGTGWNQLKKRIHQNQLHSSQSNSYGEGRPPRNDQLASQGSATFQSNARESSGEPGLSSKPSFRAMVTAMNKRRSRGNGEDATIMSSFEAQKRVSAGSVNSEVAKGLQNRGNNRSLSLSSNEGTSAKRSTSGAHENEVANPLGSQIGSRQDAFSSDNSSGGQLDDSDDDDGGTELVSQASRSISLTKRKAGGSGGEDGLGMSMRKGAVDLDSPRKKRKRNRNTDNVEQNTIWHRLFLKNTIKADSLAVNLTDFVFLITTIATLLLIMASIHPKNGYTNWQDPVAVHPGAIVWYVLMFLFSCGWIYLRCAVVVQKTQWEVVDDVSEIWKEYRGSWFVFDLLWAIPVEFLFVWHAPMFYYVSTHHFLRYVRVISLSRSSNPLVKGREWYSFLTYTLSLFVLYDVIANIFWSLEDGFGYSYAQGLDARLNFADAVYWTVVTMTSVGYGDVVATTTSSRIFTCISCLCGTIAMASLTAFATRFVTQRDVLEEELDRKKRMMHSMLNYYQIPWSVQKEVISLFPAVLDAQSEMQFKGMIEQLPVFVSDKIESYLRAKILGGVPLFKDLSDPDVILKLSEKLEQRFVPPFQNIVTVGDLGQEMFFLVRGIVEVIVPVSEDEDRVVATLRSGSFFGEIALIESTVRSATVQAMTGCELLVLAKMHFDSVLYHSAQLQARLEMEVSKRKKANDEIAPEANFNFPPTPEQMSDEDGAEGEQSPSQSTRVRPHIPAPAGEMRLPTLQLDDSQVFSQSTNKVAKKKHEKLREKQGNGPPGTEMEEYRQEGSLSDEERRNDSLAVPNTEDGNSSCSSADLSFADMSIQAHFGGLRGNRRQSATKEMMEKQRGGQAARHGSQAKMRRSSVGAPPPPPLPTMAGKGGKSPREKNHSGGGGASASKGSENFEFFSVVENE